ncbi:MAG: GIY-YIG nuclease family protein [Candidatus Sulfotelmatobacter sp.]
MASKSRVLYIGMTNDLSRRTFEHKNGLMDGFSKKYRCHRLVYYESFDDVNKAIDREKQLKRWNRTKKEWLIAQRNPTWSDLAAEWYLRHQFEPERKPTCERSSVIPSGEDRLRSGRSSQSRDLLLAGAITANWADVYCRDILFTTSCVPFQRKFPRSFRNHFLPEQASQ